jgi:O-methyltransferase involved in polyketide biosynthesis
MQQINANDRDFSTISPSAKLLLILKGITDIPFAREAAELIFSPEEYALYFKNKDIGFWARVVHFENRYKSIDQLLSEISVKNVLELSSGFSFRGLNAIKQSGIHYIDTDLPNVIAVKKEILTALQGGNTVTDSQIEILPLNALDENQFNEITDRFPDGEIVIINEGLLVYLNTDEKEKLCSIIHNVLKKRGGYWITADIYIENHDKKAGLNMDDDLQQFFDQHHIEENKFESFEAAEKFFRKAGFTIDKKAEPDNTKITTLKYLLENATEEQLLNLRKAGKIQATWRLKVADN